ncbi:uncharacterized protein LOC128955923 [Oppia nitens]|uniref:uncharacterized protein LOC128955923 n=1 Tax=Oppia nitens TaxID=1686743 RepID=UPI0023DC2532|nr:uncharacterized protein LOC128955923 [Oppia nitens]
MTKNINSVNNKDFNVFKMMAQLTYIQLIIIIFTLSFIPFIVSTCNEEVHNCLDKFASNLETHKKHQFQSTDSQLSDICDAQNGIYSGFVQCITKTADSDGACATDINFRQYVCETRKLKMRINRFNWKPTFFHRLCHNPTSDLSQGFIRHEECISGIFNTRNWKCDVNYDKPIKAIKEWKNNINMTCSLWTKFRYCSQMDIRQKCGPEAAIIADQLFHSHQSYFEKYNACQLEGAPIEQCWFDLLRTAPTTMPTTLTTVKTIESQTFSNDNNNGKETIDTNVANIGSNDLSDDQSISENWLSSDNVNSNYSTGDDEDHHQQQQQQHQDNSLTSSQTKDMSPKILGQLTSGSIEYQRVNTLKTFFIY